MNKGVKFPSVSIVIPTRNRKVSLLSTLTSISKLNYPKNQLEVIVIDNASVDTRNPILKTNTYHLKQIIIKNKTNKGFAPALNQGIRKSAGEYIFITNDDVIFDKKCLSELIKCIELDPKIAIIGGKMLFKDSKKMALPGFRVNLWLGYHPYDYKNPNKVREMDVATGGCMLIRRSTLSKFGLFDEGFFFCGEDYDICFRAKYAGHKIMYCPTAVCFHEFLGSGAKKQKFNQLFAHFRGKFRFLLIHASFPQLLFFFPIQLTIGPLLSYKQSKQVTILPIFKALSWNLQNLSATINARKNVHNLKKKNKYAQ